MLKCFHAILATFALWTGSPHAQEFPQRPIRIIVPWAPASPADITARLVSGHVSQTLGQPVVVENRPGAGGTVGLMEFVKYPPDGYTLMTFSPAQSLTPVLYPKIPVDLRKALAPVVLLESFDNVLVVGADSPIKSVADLIALARARPDKLSFASGGNGTPAHMSGELFKQSTGIAATHVPYNSLPQAITDIIAGRIDYMFLAALAAVPQVRGGKLRALAATGSKRIPTIEDVPTMRESGFPDFVVSSWDAIVAPAGTPAPVIARLNGAFNKALAMPDVRSALAKITAEPIGGEAAELGRLIEQNIDRWGQVARNAGVKAD